jgi:phage tail sheath protein FI
MRQNDLDNGRLICLIGFGSTKPGEFAIFRVAHAPDLAQFTLRCGLR